MGPSDWLVTCLITSETPRCWLKDRCLGLIPDPLNWNIPRDAQECSSNNPPGDVDQQQSFPVLAVPGMGRIGWCQTCKLGESLGLVSEPGHAEILLLENEKTSCEQKSLPSLRQPDVFEDFCKVYEYFPVFHCAESSELVLGCVQIVQI